TIALAAPFAASHATSDPVVHAQSDARVPAQRFVCGYDPHGSTDELSTHKSNFRALRNRDHEILSRRNLASAPVENAEDIALVQDDGSIVVSPAKFDLKNSSILFTPDDDGYRISTANVKFNKDFGFRLGFFFGVDNKLDDGGDGFRDVTLIGAPFPFYGVSYDTIFIGTNGYITFTLGDTTPR